MRNGDPEEYEGTVFSESARNRDPEEYEGTVFYRTFVLLAPFYNSGTDCIYIYIYKLYIYIYIHTYIYIYIYIFHTHIYISLENQTINKCTCMSRMHVCMHACIY